MGCFTGGVELKLVMMMSSNENIFRVSGPLCGEFNSHKGQWRRALMFSLICAWTIMDDHAPEKTKTVKTKTVKKKPTMLWYNDEIKGLKRDRGKAERQWLQQRGDPIKM